MRVIAGTYRSRVLKEVISESTRSTKDRVKESIFNSIINYLPEGDILDLFAGSGSLGIEAISRGAKHCAFVENNKEANKVLKENITSLNIEPKSALVNDDYNNYLLNCGKTFDVILLDPPYSMDVLNDIVATIQKEKLHILLKNFLVL